MRKLSIDEIKKRIFETHGDKVVLDETTYKNTYTKCRLIDSDCGEFWNTIKNILKGQGHPKKSNEKLEQTNLKKYGVRRPLQSKKIQENYKQTNLNKYGFDNPAKSPQVQNKMKETNIREHGVEWIGQNEEVKEKIANTNLQKRGVRCSAQDPEVKASQIKTLNENYGVSYPFESKEIRDRAVVTWIENYGVDNPMKDKGVQENLQNTMLDLYGVKFAFQSDAFKDKAKQTNLERYGFDHPQKNPEIARKTARSRTNSIKKVHWKTNKEIVCVASYEEKVVNYLNENKINYIWQENVFTMPNGKNYTPDAFLPDLNLWIEIKGHFWKDAKEKWDWFHKEYPNSELWNKAKLKELKIKT